MSASTALAGAITFVIGALGLLDVFGVHILPFSLAVIGTLVTTAGAIVLFGLITLVGIGLMIAGLVGADETHVVTTRQQPVIEPAVVIAQPLTAEVTGTPRINPTLSDLELATLRYLARGQKPGEIAKATGVSEAIIIEKVERLRLGGYVTADNALTEKGFETLRIADGLPVYVRPAA
jgi:hypothetical protein